MIEKITDDNIKAYELFIRAHPQGSFFQTIQWRRQKPKWTWRAVLRRNDQGEITGSMAVLIRHLPLLPWSFVYCCRGPVCDPADDDTLRELLREAERIARQEQAYRLRMDPRMVSGSCDAAFLSAGFRHRRRTKTLQPCRVWRTYTNPCSGLSRDHAQSIRIAIQRRVVIQQGGRELIPRFTELMQQAALRDSFVVRTGDYYAAMTENFGRRARVFLAACDGRIAAAALVIRHGDHLTCLFECDDGDITLRAAYLLRSAILDYAVKLGCSYCEFPGLSTSRGSSEYEFAAGFGGELITYTGEWDLVLHPLVDRLSTIAEALWGPLKKRLFFIKMR